MNDIQLLETIERYILQEMEGEELANFEQQRKASPELDQLVVEYSIFFNQIGHYGDRKNFQANLNEIHDKFLETGEIKVIRPRTRVIDLVRRYQREFAVAASIAGLTALTISSLVVYFTPKANTSYVEQLSRKVNYLEKKQNALSNQITIKEIAPKIPTDVNVQSGGTSFLVDAKGYLVTNAHVIGNFKNVVVQNSRGQEFRAVIITMDAARDLAILKIEDADFKPLPSLPYGFKKTGAELGEEIFTMGYPRDEIVYGEGYLSAKTGFNGDTLACQIAVAANPGNSGGPVINRTGDVVGILSTRQAQAEGVVFASKTKNIYSMLEELRRDTAYQSLKILPGSNLKGLDRVQQIKKIEDYIFMVKTY
jgi:S1-C subfamily serine protease